MKPEIRDFIERLTAPPPPPPAYNPNPYYAAPRAIDNTRVKLTPQDERVLQRIEQRSGANISDEELLEDYLSQAAYHQGEVDRNTMMANRLARDIRDRELAKQAKGGNNQPRQ